MTAWNSRIVGHGEEDPAALVANPRNWRGHPSAQRAALSGLLDQVGWVQDVVVNRRTGHLVDGHLRVDVARGRGELRVPVVYVDLTEDEEALVLATLDPLGAMATASHDAIAELLGGVHVTDAALADLLADLGARAGLGGIRTDGLTDPDAVPDAPTAATTRPGDLWVLGEHRLLCGDSSRPADLDRLLAGGPVHLVNTDPPYNVAYEARGRTIANDNLPPDEYSRRLREWFGNVARVLLPGRSFYIWGGYANCGNYPPALAEAGLYFSQAIVWVKEHPVLSRKDFMGNHEWCFFGQRFEWAMYGWKEGAAHYFDPSVANETDVWTVKKVSSHAMVHLTEKPVELAARAIRYSSRPGETVLDLFGGSGSTLIAAEQLGRRARLMELDALYCDVIVDRWQRFTGATAVLEEGDRD